jgi:hypothetical protein
MRKLILILIGIALFGWYCVQFVRDVELNDIVFVRTLTDHSAEIVGFSKRKDYAQILFYPEVKDEAAATIISKRTVMRSDYGHINHHGEQIVSFSLNQLKEDTTYFYEVLFANSIEELEPMANELIKLHSFEKNFHVFPSRLNEKKSLRFTFGSCLLTDPIFSMDVFRQWSEMDISFSIIDGDRKILLLLFFSQMSILLKICLFVSFFFFISVGNILSLVAELCFILVILFYFVLVIVLLFRVHIVNFDVSCLFAFFFFLFFFFL